MLGGVGLLPFMRLISIMLSTTSRTVRGVAGAGGGPAPLVAGPLRCVCGVAHVNVTDTDDGVDVKGVICEINNK